MNERKTQKKTAAKPRFKLDFTEQICTPKKLIPVVIYRLYPELKTSLNRKAELAKRYIKHLLCRECKIKYVSHWTNDFHTLDGILCKSCNCSIKTAIASASKHQNSDWFKKLTQQLRFKRKAIQYELELRFNKPFSEIAKEWHIKERLSAIAMQERLLDEFRMSISPRDLQRWLGEIGIIRSHRKSLRNRVVTGRMNYSKRIIDYSKELLITIKSR